MMLRKIFPLTALLILVACDADDGWEEGVFPPWSQFRDQCNTVLAQNNFLRSYTHDTYLWYDEVIDRNPEDYDDPIEYFALLKTEGKSPSGQPKDKFHFTYDTEEWRRLSQSGISAGYGVQWALLSSTPPRELFIAYTEPNTPATRLDVPLARGARVLAIDGVDINDNTAEGIKTLNAGLSPSDLGESHEFTVVDLASTGERTVTLTSTTIISTPVQNTRVISTPTGEVGYLTFNDHIATAEQALIEAVNELNAHSDGAGIDDLVLDLRYNGGGYLALASELAYMIAGPDRTDGKIFEQLIFNDKYEELNPITGQTILPTPFYESTIFSTPEGADREPLPTLDLARVYVLTGGGTCSASEAIINGLRGIDVEVIQIGTVTCGKPYGFYGTDNCGTTYFTIQFRGINEAGFGDYSDGFGPNLAGDSEASLPGCEVADDFTALLGDESESRLAAALHYREKQACPTSANLTTTEFPSRSTSDRGQALRIPTPIWKMNRIYLPQQ